jgi:hypothetical protein
MSLAHFYRAWVERRILVFDFTCKGSVVGFNTSQDGTKTFVKVQPSSTNMGQYQRDERPGYLDVLVSGSAIKNLAAGAAVLVRGKAFVIFRDWRDPKSGTQKTFTNYRYEAESVELAKPA